MKVFNVVIVGCGRIAHRHAAVINSMEDKFRLVACHDIDIEKEKRFSEKFRCKVISDISDIKDLSVDIVVVCTPSGQHEKNIIDLASVCATILVEKPVGLSLNKLKEVEAVLATSGTQLYVVKQNRFNTAVAYAKRLVEEGKFGKQVLATTRVRWCRDDQYYKQALWRGTWRDDGGVLTNQAIHHVDLLIYLWGGVKSVTAHSVTKMAPIEAEDTIVATLEFENGALGTIEATTCVRPTNIEGSISLIGSGGFLEIGGFAANEIVKSHFVGHNLDNFIDLAEHPSDVYGNGHAKYYAFMYDEMLMGVPSSINLKEGVKSLQVVHAIYTSAEEKRQVLVENCAGYHKFEKAYERG